MNNTYVGKLLLLIFLPVLLIGCATVDISPQLTAINPYCRWGIATFTNNTETPQAGKIAMSIAANLLHAKGIVDIAVYPSYTDNSLQINNILAWARTNKIRYVMIGSVKEWQYKIDLNNDSVVAVDLQLYDSLTGLIIWSAIGNKRGSNHSSLRDIAQDLMAIMIASLTI